MAVTWEYRQSLLAVRLAGVYPNEEVARAIDEALSDPRFGPATRLLMDGRESQTPISGADVEWRVLFFSSLPGRGLFPKVAYLLRPDQRGLLSLFQLAFMTPEDRGAVEVEVFTTESEALAWLGVRPA
jgi:hypothetical protein